MSSGNCENSVKGICAVCKKPAKTRCSACCKVFYCCVDHQKQDWKNHKLQCQPFKICSNDTFGRHLIATRNIKSGEIVLKEAPLVIGPSQITAPVCVGCLQGLRQGEFLECEHCGWPICKRECQDSSSHKAECKLTQDRGDKVSIQHFYVPHPTYQCLMPLRCLLLKDTNKEQWNALLKLESHEEQRRGTDQWRSDREGVAKFIPRFFRVMDKWTEDEILKITGILQVNGHEVPLTEPHHVAIYSKASLVEHSCRPNLAKSFSKKGDIIFWAPNPIKVGEHLSICYTDVLWGTQSRQHHLRQTKLFNCTCERCKDVTEFGSYVSGMRCSGFNKSSECPGILLPAAYDHWGDDWQCNKCNAKVVYSAINQILAQCLKDFEATDKMNEEKCNKFLNHYMKWLHPNSYYFTDIKISLSQIIGGGSPTAIQSITDEKLMLKIKICQDLLKLFETIAPAETRAIGTTRFELHSALAEYGRRASEQKNPNFRGAMEESLFHAEEAARLLEYETSALTEGKIATQARMNANALKVMLGMNDLRL